MSESYYTIGDPTSGGAVNAAGLTSLQGINPAQIAAKQAAEEAAKTGAAKFGLGTLMQGLGPAYAFYSALDALGFFDKGMEATPMTPEEAARFDIDQAIEQFELQQMFGSPDAEGAGDEELINELVDRVDRTPDLSDRDFTEVLSILKAYPAAQDYDYSKDTPDEADSGGGSSSASSGLPSDPAQVAADNAAQTVADTAADIIGDASPPAGGTESDAMNVFVYDATDNVFVSASGERFPAGDVSDVPIADGGKYSVRPDLNSTGDVIAEHVVDESGNKVATVGEPDPNTGIPNLINVIGQLGAFDLPTDAPVIGPTQTPPAPAPAPAGGGPADGPTDPADGPAGDSAGLGGTGGTGPGGLGGTAPGGPTGPTGPTPCPPGMTRNAMGVCAYPTGDPGTGVGTGPGTGTGTGDGDGNDKGKGQDAVEQLFAGASPFAGTGAQVDVESGDLALINYLYDIGGESIFAPTVNAAKGGRIKQYDFVNEIERIIGRR